MDGEKQLTPKPTSNFRKFFVRGLAILLPTVLTIWIVVAAYQFVSVRIAQPLNHGVQSLIIRFSPYPAPTTDDYDAVAANLDRLSPRLAQDWQVYEDEQRAKIAPDKYKAKTRIALQREWLKENSETVRLARGVAMQRWWNSVTIGSWRVLDLVGLLLAIILIYAAGVILGSFIGRRLHRRGEELINRVPLIRRVYPSVKQVTDFFFVEKQPHEQFTRVVAVQYPRKGLWSVGLVTGNTMRQIQDAAGHECLTVFIPSSPTPFTGYVITVPVDDTLDLDISIEDAIKFAVSLGVLVPDNQRILRRAQRQDENGNGQTDASTDPPTGEGEPQTIAPGPSTSHPQQN